MVLAAGPKNRSVAAAVLPAGLDALGFAAWWGAAPYSWQRPLVEACCADDRPRVFYVQVGRKNGKSYGAAVVCIDEMVRRGGQVFLIADSERNLKSALFFELCRLVRESPQLQGCVLTYKDHLECPASGGGIYLRPNNISASQSINPTLVVFDEVHMQKTDAVWNGMVLAGAAHPRSLLLGITTPGYNMSSLAHDLYDRTKAGEVAGLIFEPSDPNCAVDDESAWVEANPVLRDRPDMVDVFRFELPPTMTEHEFRRFRLGQWTAAEAAWLPAGAWAACRSPEWFDWSRRTWVGFDGSYSGDSTALVAVNDVGQVDVVGVWERPPSYVAEGWRVPRDEVRAAVERVMAHDQATLLADPPYWQSEIAEWGRRWPRRVLEFPTGSAARMAPACTAFYAAVLEGRVRDCSSGVGRAVLAAHLANAVTKPTQFGTVITKQKEWSPLKIDAAVALVVAASVALMAKPERDIVVL